jgi:hypothetical protein
MFTKSNLFNLSKRWYKFVSMWWSHLPNNLGRSLSSRQTAMKNSSECPFFMAPSGTVKLTPVQRKEKMI